MSNVFDTLKQRCRKMVTLERPLKKTLPDKYFLTKIFIIYMSAIKRFQHMSGNSQGVKRPYLGHKVIPCNTPL